MGNICDRCDTEMSLTFRKGTERICADCHNKEVKEREKCEAVVRLNNLLSSLIVEEKEYKSECAKDNPDHWSRGYNAGCLKTVQRAIAKIKMAT